MDKTLVALLIGLVAGVGGGYAVHLFSSGQPGGSADTGGDMGAVLERLDRIEAKLEKGDPAMTLRAPTSSARKGGALEHVAAQGDQAIEALLDRIDERVGKTVSERVDKKLSELKGGVEVMQEEPAKPKMTLAEAAVEIGLTAQEEDDLRQIYTDVEEEMLKIIAKPDGDVEEIRRDIEEARGKPGGGISLMTKYMPKLMTNLGDFIALQATTESKIRKAIGKDKHDALEKIDVKESHPFGLGGDMSFRMEAEGD